MVIDSKEFGKIEIDAKQMLQFDRGIYGFEQCTTWALLDTPKKPFYILQSLTELHVSFILINPYLICDDYVLDVAEGDIDNIDNPTANDLLVFSIVSIRENPKMVTANLAGPLLINRHRRCGVQAVQQDTRWDTRFQIVVHKPATV